jgi:hypothetical protein
LWCHDSPSEGSASQKTLVEWSSTSKRRRPKKWQIELTDRSAWAVPDACRLRHDPRAPRTQLRVGSGEWRLRSPADSAPRARRGMASGARPEPQRRGGRTERSAMKSQRERDDEHPRQKPQGHRRQGPRRLARGSTDDGGGARATVPKPGRAGRRSPDSPRAWRVVARASPSSGSRRWPGRASSASRSRFGCKRPPSPAEGPRSGPPPGVLTDDKLTLASVWLRARVARTDGRLAVVRGGRLADAGTDARSSRRTGTCASLGRTRRPTGLDVLTFHRHPRQPRRRAGLRGGLIV